MEQARHHICESCMAGIPAGHKFCGRCGAPVSRGDAELQTTYFSDMQNPGKARLILIRGDGQDGLSYHLKAEQHILGRQGQLEFPSDSFVSPRHANFFYRDGDLVVRDEGSLNGVYVRIRGSAEIAPSDTFIAGDQIFRLELPPNTNNSADAEGTYYYGSPRHQAGFRIVQLFEGGVAGATFCSRGSTARIGREDCDLNFRNDRYLSPRHCTIELSGEKFKIIDHDSKNGTYLRLKTERTLNHGDYVYIGRKLLRVERNT